MRGDQAEMPRNWCIVGDPWRALEKLILIIFSENEFSHGLHRFLTGIELVHEPNRRAELRCENIAKVIPCFRFGMSITDGLKRYSDLCQNQMGRISLFP